jgi:hypothetical protein
MGLNASQQTCYMSVSGFEIYGHVTGVHVNDFAKAPGKFVNNFISVYPQNAGAEMQPRSKSVTPAPATSRTDLATSILRMPQSATSSSTSALTSASLFGVRPASAAKAAATSNTNLLAKQTPTNTATSTTSSNLAQRHIDDVRSSLGTALSAMRAQRRYVF